MNRLFIPFLNNSPLTLSIKGHRLLIVSTDKEDCSNYQKQYENCIIKEYEILEENEEDFFQELTQQYDTGIVVAPIGADMQTVIDSLEHELPWVQ